jgi:hypothetical protein
MEGYAEEGHFLVCVCFTFFSSRGGWTVSFEVVDRMALVVVDWFGFPVRSFFLSLRVGNLEN